MLKQITLLFISSFLFIGWQCGGNDNPVNPEKTSQMLFYCNFEPTGYNNTGWYYSDSTAKNYISFSRDVPYPTDFQSLKLQKDTVTNYVPAIDIKIVNTNPYGSKKYNVNYYCKGKGEIIVEIHSSNEIRSTKIALNSQLWKNYYTPTLNCGTKVETLKVTFKPLANDQSTYLFIDDVSIETIPQ